MTSMYRTCIVLCNSQQVSISQVFLKTISIRSESLNKVWNARLKPDFICALKLLPFLEQMICLLLPLRYNIRKILLFPL